MSIIHWELLYMKAVFGRNRIDATRIFDLHEDDFVQENVSVHFAYAHLLE